MKLNKRQRGIITRALVNYREAILDDIQSNGAPTESTKDEIAEVENLLTQLGHEF